MIGYFDWNATAPLCQAARVALEQAQDEFWANPSTLYRRGARAHAALADCRERVARLMGCPEATVIFTSGATEASNGLLRALARRDGPIWLSHFEHPAVRQAALAFFGPERVEWLPVLPTGCVDMDWISDALDSGASPAALCLMAASNETGIIQPWESVAALCQERGIFFYSDAVQMIGKGQGNPDWRKCTGLSFSGHKLGGPKGVGVLLLNEGTDELDLVLQHGGTQEAGHRAGTEAVPLIYSMCAALEDRMQCGGIDPGPRDAFEQVLAAELPFSGKVIGSASQRLPNTSLLTLPHHRSERWIRQLDKLGYCVGSGSACSSGTTGPSPVLTAMGIDEAEALNSLRISSGWETTPEEWKSLAVALGKAFENLEASQSSGPGVVIEL
jgi:cysteine desulfurase